MRKKNGFTLIELLAVIVILAIIALIAVPIVINIINKARKSAFQDSAYGIVKAGELYYAESLLKQEGFEIEKTFTFPSDTELEFKGTKPSNGTLKINTSGEIELIIHNGAYCATKGYKDTGITVEKKSLEDCGITEAPPTPVLYQEEILNGAYPEIGQGMIPVTIENDGTVKKADLYTSWYSYQDKKWANVVTVTEASRSKYTSAAVGTTIAEADILTYLVWIPRYRYQLWNVSGNTAGTHTSPFEIQITFENKDTPKSTGTSNDAWLTHSSFTFGTEINGFWVGKFETSWPKDDLLVKPNQGATGSTISINFAEVQNMKKENNVYGISNTADPHIMKNSEWGAVAYLSHSTYGINKNIRRNNAYFKSTNSYGDVLYYTSHTGCAASSDASDYTRGCENRWNTETGYLASTTGNIAGIYDMSGGSWEVVMGYTTGASPQYGESDFTTSNFPSSKYIDRYTATTDTQYTNGKLGDATKETGPFDSNGSAWYQSFNGFVYSASPWFKRGGRLDEKRAGIFGFSSTRGGNVALESFRIVMLGK